MPGSGSGHWPADAPAAAVAAGAPLWLDAAAPAPPGGGSLAHWAATGFDLDALDLVDDGGKTGGGLLGWAGTPAAAALRARGADAPPPPPLPGLADIAALPTLDELTVGATARPAAPAPAASRRASAGGHRLRPRSAAPRLTRVPRAADDDDAAPAPPHRASGLRKAPSAAASLTAVAGGLAADAPPAPVLVAAAAGAAAPAAPSSLGDDCFDGDDPSSTSAAAAAARRKGKGGRQPALDPRLDPAIDPKRARRILANRLSAARSKLKQKSHLEALRRWVDALAYHRACLVSELERAREAAARGAAENAELGARLAALTAHVASLAAYRTRLEAAAGGPLEGAPPVSAMTGDVAAAV